MPDPFIGEIIMFAGNFAPRGWALCEGQLLSISSNQALFSILGTTYGGDGRTTFALPDLRGRAPIQPGAGPGLTNRQLGQKGGGETVTLTTGEIPSHSHTVNASTERGSQTAPTGHVLTEPKDSNDLIYTADAPNTTMSASMIANTGGGGAHNNMQPFLGINFIIALVGVFPSRN